MMTFFKTASDGKWTFKDLHGNVNTIKVGITLTDDHVPESTARLMCFYFFRWVLIIGWNAKEKKS